MASLLVSLTFHRVYDLKMRLHLSSPGLGPVAQKHCLSYTFLVVVYPKSFYKSVWSQIENHTQFGLIFKNEYLKPSFCALGARQCSCEPGEDGPRTGLSQAPRVLQVVAPRGGSHAGLLQES